jgi:hypothetical protein
VDLQWQAKLERYDKTIAQAYEIIERWRREELEDNDIISSRDSNSELSALASSLFNGMEGIEMGGDSEVLSGISGSRNTTSPRITRSGKIVKYQDE